MQSIKYRITIIRNGPYVVTGNVPISEKVIVPVGNSYEYRPGRALPQAETYALCRCGKSKNPPFCDGAHIDADFQGGETASCKPYHERAKRITGADIDLLDDGRCAFARFCHRDEGDAWELTERSHIAQNRAEAIKAACECPSGRLTAVDKDGTEHEIPYEPSIEVLQDPERGVSAGLFVKGGIIVESSDGTAYEPRNRIVLCRCGKSHNKPFCDATHVACEYRDQ